MAADFQRQKVYNAEDWLSSWCYAGRRNGDLPTYWPTFKANDTAAATEWLNGILAMDEVQARFGEKAEKPVLVVINPRLRGGVAYQSARRIEVGKLDLTGRILIHELAHILTPTVYPGHGAEFAANQRWLYELLAPAYVPLYDKAMAKMGVFVGWDREARARRLKEKGRLARKSVLRHSDDDSFWAEVVLHDARRFWGRVRLIHSDNVLFIAHAGGGMTTGSPADIIPLTEVAYLTT